MTTIAYRRGILASDSRVTMVEQGESPHIVSDKEKKIWRLPDGRLFAASRGCEDGVRLYNLMRAAKPGTKPSLKLDDINAILIDLNGTIWFYEGNIWQKVKEPWIAIGSGSRVGAIPAMMAGASAKDAVRIGIKCDPYSGGRIQVLKLRPGNRAARSSRERTRK
jgi:hypothetical protein